MFKGKRYVQDGSSTVVILIMIIIFLVLFAGVLDVCRIFICRENTRNAADAVSLAVAQEMVFFEYHHELESIAEEMARRHRCRLESLNITYDKATASVVSEIKLLLLDRFGDDVWNVRSVSSTEVTYPWDGRLGLYRYYEFSFMDEK